MEQATTLGGFFADILLGIAVGIGFYLAGAVINAVVSFLSRSRAPRP